MVAKVPVWRWKTTTFVAALLFDRIDAQWLLEGPIDGKRLSNLLCKALAPTLRTDDIVIMDNLGSPQGQSRARPHSLGWRQTWREPVEQVFAKLKHLLRKATARIILQKLRLPHLGSSYC